MKHVPDHVKAPKNQRGAYEFATKLDEYISAELCQQSVIGPFSAAPFDGARISPIDALPKKDSDDVRVILNLSYPPDSGAAVNDVVDKDCYLGEPTNLTYPSIDDLVSLILLLGPGCALMKVDLKKYYRQIYLDPGSIHLLGFQLKDNSQLKDKLFFDITLSMGLRIACYIAQRISSAILFLYNSLGFLGLNYLDDLAGTCGWSKAFEAFEQLYTLLNKLRIWESTHKRCSPDVEMPFLGILANTISMTLSLTTSRLQEIKDEAQQWLCKEAASKKDMQRLIGKLNFAAGTVRAGRLFYSRIISFMTSLPRHGIRKLDSEVRRDIRWWAVFLDQFNGISMIPEAGWRTIDSVISTDACATGIGGFAETEGEYFHAVVPSDILDDPSVHINELECLAVTLALRIWGERLQRCNLLLHCDNQSTVDVINSGRAKNRFTQACLREILFVASKYSFQIRVKFRPGVQNRLADCLSRWHLDDSFRDRFFAELVEDRACDLEKIKQVLIANSLFKFIHDW